MALSLGNVSQQPIAETVGRESEEMPTLWIAAETAGWEHEEMPTFGNAETAGWEQKVAEVMPVLDNAETAGWENEVVEVMPALDNAATAGQEKEAMPALGNAEAAAWQHEEMPTLEKAHIAKEDATLARTLQDEEDKFQEAFLSRRNRMTRKKACIWLVGSYVAVISFATFFSLMWILTSSMGHSDGAPTWVKVYNYNLDVDSAEVYAVAFHWAISKFTFSSVEPTLTPQNATEKVLDFIVALFAVFLAYPLLGSVVALISKLLPLFPPAEATRKQLAIRLLILGSALILQWVLFAVMWMEVPGSQRDLEIGKPVVGQPTSEFTSVFRHSAEKDVAHGLHWSLCQFSLASLTIVPPSYEERVAAIFVQLIGFWTMYPLIAAATWTAFRLFPQSLRPYAL
eukprot:TRINITY_DN7090_c0_g1_i6.p1 TRINITY_DN7090_c0_g1~~TRINITY_DN7090_c0_g1_i6.p1  ORF type:complete len:399 (-),score=77.29 TRINITY_DN7090_c0_g1_i6:197-1393(-)